MIGYLFVFVKEYYNRRGILNPFSLLIQIQNGCKSFAVFSSLGRYINCSGDGHHEAPHPPHTTLLNLDSGSLRVFPCREWVNVFRDKDERTCMNLKSYTTHIQILHINCLTYLHYIKYIRNMWLWIMALLLRGLMIYLHMFVCSVPNLMEECDGEW